MFTSTHTVRQRDVHHGAHHGQHGRDGAPETAGRLVRWARFYDPVVWLLSLGRASAMRAATLDLAAIAPGEAVLDVGCGTGDLTMGARRRTGAAGRVCGIDAAPEMIAVARRKAARKQLAIDYRVAAVEALPFADESFDLVLSSLMMHHLPPEVQGRGLAEIARVLKPGGRLVVVDFQWPSGARAHVSLPLLFHRHLRRHTAARMSELPALVSAAGFSDVETGDVPVGPLGYVRARRP